MSAKPFTPDEFVRSVARACGMPARRSTDVTDMELQDALAAAFPVCEISGCSDLSERTCAGCRVPLCGAHALVTDDGYGDADREVHCETCATGPHAAAGRLVKLGEW